MYENGQIRIFFSDPILCSTLKNEQMQKKKMKQLINKSRLSPIFLFHFFQELRSRQSSSAVSPFTDPL